MKRIQPPRALSFRSLSIEQRRDFLVELFSMIADALDVLQHRLRFTVTLLQLFYLCDQCR